MNKLMRFACGAVSLVLASSAFSADAIRAGYEVILTDGKDTWQATTVVPVEPGQPILQGLGPYVVSMSVQEDRADRYGLLVRVTGLPGTATENSEFLRESFPGNHKEQLEFAATEAGLSVKGVIFVGPPRSAAK